MLPIAIIAGGLGTRLAAITTAIPKALVPIAGRPFIDWQLELIAGKGLIDVVLCVGHLGEMIEAHVGDGTRFGCRVKYSYDGTQRIGTAGALAKALPLLQQRFFMTYGDSYLDCDYAAVESAFLAEAQPALMTVYRNEDRFVPSNVRFRNGRIEAYEKAHPDSSMQYVDYGLSVFDAAALERVPLDQPTDLSSIFQPLVANGRLAGFEVPMRFYEVGTPESVAELEIVLRDRPFSQPQSDG